MFIHDCLQDMVEWYQAVRCLKFRIKKETRVEKDEEIVSIFSVSAVVGFTKRRSFSNELKKFWAQFYKAV